MSRTFFSIQYLRGVAALMVVYTHASVQTQRYADVELPFSAHGAAGVDIFFVISGFIMWMTTIGDTPTSKPLPFISRRISRIVPLYWVLTTGIVIVGLVRPDLLSSTVITVWHVLASFFFIPYPHPADNGSLVPVLIPGWTLNYEMFFYAIFACSLTVKPKFRLPLLFLM